jgi:hypothetical protein
LPIAANAGSDIFPPCAIAYDCAGECFLRVTCLPRRESAPPWQKRNVTSHQQGVWAMKYVIGFIIGVALTVGGAWLYDNMGSGVASPLVNWTTANALMNTAVGDVRSQVDRLAKQLGII